MNKMIRDVKPELLKMLVQFDKENLGAGGLDEWSMVPAIRHGRVFARFDNEKLVASAQFLRDWDNPHLAYLIGVSVAKDSRGKGLGTELLKESFIQLRSDGITEIELTVSPDNHQAIDVYQRKLGFVVREFRPNEYGDGEDRLALVLIRDDSAS